MIFCLKVNVCTDNSNLKKLKLQKKKVILYMERNFTDTFNLFYICGHPVLFIFSSQRSLNNTFFTVIAKMKCWDSGQVHKDRLQQHCEGHVSLLMYKLA